MKKIGLFLLLAFVSGCHCCTCTCSYRPSATWTAIKKDACERPVLRAIEKKIEDHNVLRGMAEDIEYTVDCLNPCK